MRVDLHDRIAALARDRVLVAGSLPSPDSDLDLLIRPGDRDVLEQGLAAAGFEGRDGVWVRFETGEVVDLTDAAAWRLDQATTESLFADAVPIEPLGRVCRPAPHHSLLILARRAMRDGAALLTKRSARITVELEEDPDAFEKARATAGAWGASQALEALERAYREGRSIPAAQRRRAIAEELASSRDRRGAAIGSLRAVLRRPRWGRLVQITGPDGAGRARQADELASLLEKIGFDVARMGGDAGAPAIFRQLLRGGLIVHDTADDAGGGAPAPGIRPLIAHRYDPEGDEGGQRAEIARKTWAALVA